MCDVTNRAETRGDATVLAAASPSLTIAADGTRGGYELKFLVDERQARDVMAWARRHLVADPHGDIAGDDADCYRVNTLYLDTPGLDVFHRTGLLGRRKYRLRRYGAEPVVWLEVKQKRAGVVRKRRGAVAEADLVSRLVGPIGGDADADRWFRDRVDRHELRPACRVTYRRFARLGPTPGGAVRLTLDDEIRGETAEGWNVPSAPLDAPPLLEGRKVLELKFRGAMPGLFRGLVMDFGLEPGKFSKYREGAVDALPLSRLFPEAPATAGVGAFVPDA